MAVSKLDLLVMGKRNPIARMNQAERDIRAQGIGHSEQLGDPQDSPASQAPPLTTDGAGADAGISQEPSTPTRPNLLQNTGFESFDNGATTPKLWTATGTVSLAENKDAITGTHVVQLTDGGELSQEAPLGVNLPDCSIVVSVFARVQPGEGVGQTVNIGIQHAPGYEAGEYSRHFWSGGMEATNELPDDGQWYRITRSFVLVGGGTLSVTFQQSGEAGTVEIDGAKLEQASANGQDVGYIQPTAYEPGSGDWGVAEHVRNLSADNVVAGTLSVGGSSSENPRIRVLDMADSEVVTIGSPIGGYYGIHVKALAGIEISGGGTLEVNSNFNVTSSGLFASSGAGAAFGIAAANAVSFGGFTLDQGDVLMGRSTANYVKWDASAGQLLINGQIVIGTTNRIWLNDANDGALNIGGATKASAPFRVTAAGALTATNATITGNITMSAGGINLGTTNHIWLNDANDGVLAVGGATKASAPFRVTAAGALTATNADITGTINFGGGHGRLNSTGITIIAATSPSSLSDPEAIVWRASTFSGEVAGYIQGSRQGTSSTISIRVNDSNTARGSFTVYVAPPSVGSYEDAGLYMDSGYSTRPESLTQLISSNIQLEGKVIVNGSLYGGDYFGTVKEVIRTNDTYLRLNQAGHFTTGVYTPGAFRADGAVLLNSNATVTNNLSVGDHMNLNGQALSSATVISLKGDTDTSASWGIVYKMVDGTTNNFFVQGNGAGYLRAAAWTYGSDIRLKQNIQPMSSKLLHLMALRPVTFDYINGEADQFGFIAQEVQEVLPELVKVTDEETGLLGLKTTNLIPMLVQALQELVTQYRADMAEIRGALADLTE